MRFADLDCVTVDAYGTLVTLENPVPELERGLRAQGVERSPEEIAAAFRTEIEYYSERTLEGRDTESLLQLRRECCGVFLAALAAELDPDDFLIDFAASLRFRPEDSVVETLRELKRRGLALAVVSNWDCSLADRLEETGLREFFDLVAVSALVGAAKPDPQIFEYALERLSAPAERSLHVGDSESDKIGAQAAGMQFAPAPLATAFEGWQ